VVLFGRFAQQHETLRVGDDLGGQQRLANVLDESLLVAFELELRPFKMVGGLDAVAFMALRQRAKTASPMSVSGCPGRAS